MLTSLFKLRDFIRLQCQVSLDAEKRVPGSEDFRLISVEWRRSTMGVFDSGAPLCIFTGHWNQLTSMTYKSMFHCSIQPTGTSTTVPQNNERLSSRQRSHHYVVWTAGAYNGVDFNEVALEGANVPVLWLRDPAAWRFTSVLKDWIAARVLFDQAWRITVHSISWRIAVSFLRLYNAPNPTCEIYILYMVVTCSEITMKIYSSQAATDMYYDTSRQYDTKQALIRTEAEMHLPTSVCLSDGNSLFLNHQTRCH